MIAVCFYAGLGNQMYQAALYFVLSRLYPNTNVKADLSYFKFQGHIEHQKKFDLMRFFNTKIDIASDKEIKTICHLLYPKNTKNWSILRKRKYEKNFIRLSNLFCLINKHQRIKRDNFLTNYQHNVFVDMVFNLSVNHDYYLHGLWQNVKFFENYKEDILKQFTFKRPLPENLSILMKEIIRNEAVCIHVRGGDFLNNQNLNICKETYYNKALDVITRRINENNVEPKFYVFTDDAEYVKRLFCNIKIEKIINNGVENCDYDMHLLSQSNNLIISNSTFGFWSAYIGNQKKVVIAPQFSLYLNGYYTEFSTPNDWIKIDNR